MSAWEGHILFSPRLLRGLSPQRIVIQHRSFGEACEMVLNNRPEGGGSFGIRNRVEVQGLGDEPGIWEVDDHFRPISRLTVSEKPAEPEPEPIRHCGCGCGVEVRNRFRPGHDSKLKGRLIRAAKGTGILDPPYGEETNPWKVASDFGWLSYLPRR